MKFNKILIIFTFLIITSCDQYKVSNKAILDIKPEKKYKNTGFTLIYDKELSIKKLDDRSLNIYHSYLKKKSFVKITNPSNKKSLIAEVISNKEKYSNFYNSVISTRIAETLELDLNEPLVEIILISKDSTFIAKKAKTFEEEKEVAEKAPIDGIKINDLNDSSINKSKKFSNDKFSYSIKVADFYYKKTAEIMIDRIKKESMTFKIAASEYIETHKVQWTNKKHAKQWTSTLEKYVYPKIGKLPVYHITNNHILNILKPIWGVKHETASRVRQRIEKILNWSITLGYRDHPNPAALNGNLEYLLPKSSAIRSVQHHRSLPYENLPEFVSDLKKTNLYSAKALLFLILTASRTSEVIAAEWDEFNFKLKIWNIPENRIKIRNKHSVTLNESALELLKELKNISDSKYVFPGTKADTHISNNSMLKLLKNNFPEIYKQSVTHGFRSSFRDWAEEQHNFSRRAVELCLSHQNRNKTEDAYLRTKLINKRHHIMDEWDNFLFNKKKRNVKNV